MSTAQILVVEDEGIVAKSIQSELQLMGYRVPSIASSGEEALLKIEGTPPDLVLMDIVLKGDMDGIEAGRRIRCDFDIPVVYLTAYEDDDVLQRARVTEPFGYLLKPIEEKELHTTIEMALYKHRMEQRLKETKRWLATVLHSIDDAVIATDGRQRIRFLNPVAQALTGWKEEEALDQDLNQVCTLIHSQTFLLLDNPALHAARENQPVDLGAHVLLEARDGKETPIEGTAAPIHDEGGAFAGVVLIFRDISARAQIERVRRLSEEHLRHAQKMEAVSRLAGGVAHDFNNLLTAILGGTSLVLSNLPADDPNVRWMTRVEDAALHAAKLVKQLLAFSGRRSALLEPANWNASIATVLERLAPRLDSRIVVDFEPGEALWLVRADSPQLNEAVLNLCLNAVDAMPEGGRLQLETENITITDEHLRTHLAAEPGEFVRLRVSDTGKGMSPEVQAHIFEPFFTTKEGSHGAGLGLALVFGIVREHQGWVECHSEPDRGTHFDVYLPRYSYQAPTPTPVVQVPHQGAEAILLTDDDATIRDVGRIILERCGYRVLLASDGAEAVEVYQRAGNRIDLVILDLTMPRLSGNDAFKQLLQINPEVRVLFSSGYFAEHMTAEHQHILGFIGKPYQQQEMIATVRTALEEVRAKRFAHRPN